MLVKRFNCQKALINLNEMLLAPPFFAFLFGEDAHANKEALEPFETGKNEKSLSCQLKKGRKSIYETYPDLVNCVTNFLKQNSFAAERRTSTTTQTGVTLEQIRTHIYTMIPELKERRISRNTSTTAPNKRNKNAVWYKSFIDAKVPKKSNSYKEENVDSHFLFSRIRQFYIESMSPNYNDHDSPCPGLLSNTFKTASAVVGQEYGGSGSFLTARTIRFRNACSSQKRFKNRI